MGESLVEAPNVENKMGESVSHVPCLQESISFGRFEHDSLCWERWSTFPTNKYLEEVEKCSTPGSVAQKKAYFEAHYKRIAARKIELMDLEKKREADSVNSEDQRQTLMDSVTNSSEELEVENSDTNIPVFGTELESQSTDFTDVVNDVHFDVPSCGVGITNEESKVPNDGTNTTIEENEAVSFTTGEHIDEPNGVVDIIKENKNLQPQLEDITEDLCSKKESPELKPEEPDFVEEETVSTLVSQDKEELPRYRVEERGIGKKETEDVVKLGASKKMQMATSVKINTNSTSAKKKPASSMPKGSVTLKPKRSAALMQQSSMLSTPNSSKPVLSKTVMSAARPSVKKENGFTPVTGEKAVRPESKRVLSASLHMSTSLGPANSNTRKSLIMETMGDKDIVKRAFKAFQSSNHLSSSGLARSPASNQSVTEKIEQKGSGPSTLQKKNEGILRSVVKAASPQAGQQGTRKTFLSPGLRKTMVVDQRNGKSIPSSFGSRSLDQGNKQKEVSKKLDQKSMNEEAGKTYLQSKVMSEKAVEIRISGQRINSKPKRSSSFNNGRASKALPKLDLGMDQPTGFMVCICHPTPSVGDAFLAITDWVVPSTMLL